MRMMKAKIFGGCADRKKLTKTFRFICVKIVIEKKITMFG